MGEEKGMHWIALLIIVIFAIIFLIGYSIGFRETCEPIVHKCNEFINDTYYFCIVKEGVNYEFSYNESEAKGFREVKN